MVEFLRVVLCGLELVVAGDFLLGNRRLEISLVDYDFLRHRCQCNLHLYGSETDRFQEFLQQLTRWPSILIGRIRPLTGCLWRSTDRMGTTLPDVPQEDILEGVVPYWLGGPPNGEECL